MDETYERVLKDIKEYNRENARLLFHCLVVAVRPLSVEELAEILTFDFVNAQEGIPGFRADRRPKDQEADVLALCSSLITVVDNGDSRVVQFSHLSVKEFLMSNHLSSSTGDLTLYHIRPGPAHTILAQVCLGLLLLLDDSNDNKSAKDSPLVEYAARHWVAHAQFEDVASRVEGGMKSLFDPGRPHFAAWRDLHDIDAESVGESQWVSPSPLYYSALCGFSGLVRHIAMKHPEDINAVGGSLGFPLVAALCRNHLAVAEILLEHGARVDVRDTRQQTVLHETIDQRGKVSMEAVRFLLDHGADVNARRDDLCTPLHLAVNNGELSVARLLLDRHAGVNSRNDAGRAPLHLLSIRETSQDKDDGSDIAKLLLERGAKVNEKDRDNATPLHLASYNSRPEIARVLLEHGANPDAENDQGETPLQLAFSKGNHDAEYVALLLLEHNAQVYARDKYHIPTSDLAHFVWKKIGPMFVGSGGNFKWDGCRNQTAFRLWIEGEYFCRNVVSGCHSFFVECDADSNTLDKYDTILLHSASYLGRLEMVRILLNHGVKSNAKNHWGETALHVMSRSKHYSNDSIRVAKLLLERGVDVNTQDKDHDSPLHSASYSGKLELVRVLLSHGAIANSKNDEGETPLHRVSQGEYESQEDGVRIAGLLLDRGVDVNAQEKNGAAPLHLASSCGKLKIAQLLLDDDDVEVDILDVQGNTPLHTVSHGRYDTEEVSVGLVLLLLEHSADVNARNMDWRQQTPLHLSSYTGNLAVARLLLDNGANVDDVDSTGETPLYMASRLDSEAASGMTQLLLQHGADMNIGDSTSLHMASYGGDLKLARLLLDNGANVNAVDHNGSTPLHEASWCKVCSEEEAVDVARLLLQRGGNVNAQDKKQSTPLHIAAYRGSLEIARLLLDHGAKVDTMDVKGNTPLHDISTGKYWDTEVDIARLLLEHGADVNAKSRSGESPLDMASQTGRDDVAKFLLEHGGRPAASSSRIGSFEW